MLLYAGSAKGFHSPPSFLLHFTCCRELPLPPAQRLRPSFHRPLDNATLQRPSNPARPCRLVSPGLIRDFSRIFPLSSFHQSPLIFPQVRAIPGAHTTACLPSLFQSPPAEWWLAAHVAGREVVTVLDDGTRCQIRGQGAPHHGDISAAYITAYVQDEVSNPSVMQE